MPVTRQTIIENYARIFHCDNQTAEREFSKLQDDLMKANDNAMMRSLIDEYENSANGRDLNFNLEYKPVCSNYLSEAYARNIQSRLRGEGGADLDKVTADCIELIELATELTLPRRANSISSAFFNSDIAKLRMTELGKIERAHINGTYSELNAPDENGKAVKVKQRTQRAVDRVENTVIGITPENADEKCRSAVLIARVMEIKHATRSGLWKFFHPIDNYREKRAIADMNRRIGENFTAEQIALARSHAVGYSFLKEEWEQAEKLNADEARFFKDELEKDPSQVDLLDARAVADKAFVSVFTQRNTDNIAKPMTMGVDENGNSIESEEQAAEREEFEQVDKDLHEIGLEDYDPKTAKRKEYKEKHFSKAIAKESENFDMEGNADFVEDIDESLIDFNDRESIFVDEANEKHSVETSEKVEQNQSPELNKLINK
ncbi:MAG: hypothetical protein ACI4L9_06360 [Candidatus Coproplasma sp.]